MFVGHYAAGLALKKVEKNAPLGLLFLAVQFVDILFFPFAVLGIERFKIVEHYTASTHFVLEYMPFTHSLVASVLWAAAVYLFIRFFPFKWKGNRKRIALVVAIAVLSHWFLDLIVHTPDLPLFTDASPKLGFGLWNNAVATYLLEAILLLIGLRLYLTENQGTTFWGKYGMVLFVGLMLIVNAVNIFGPPLGATISAMAASALFFYVAFAGVAHWLEKQRSA